MKKVSLRIEDEILEVLMILCGTDNVSEASYSLAAIFLFTYFVGVWQCCGYLPWNAKVVVNDINGSLTNLYQTIWDRPLAFIYEVGIFRSAV